MLPYLALLRMGFTVPLDVAASAVGSYLAEAFTPALLLAQGHRFTLT